MGMVEFLPKFVEVQDNVVLVGVMVSLQPKEESGKGWVFWVNGQTIHVPGELLQM